MRYRPMTRVKYEDMRFVFVSDYYDLPLRGTCRIRTCCSDNDLGEFRIREECVEEILGDIWYECFELTRLEKIAWKIRQRLFEVCVGRHCTREEPKGYWINTEALSDRTKRILFKLYYLTGINRI